MEVFGRLGARVPRGAQTNVGLIGGVFRVHQVSMEPHFILLSSASRISSLPSPLITDPELYPEPRPHRTMRLMPHNPSRFSHSHPSVSQITILQY